MSSTRPERSGASLLCRDASEFLNPTPSPDFGISQNFHASALNTAALQYMTQQKHVPTANMIRRLTAALALSSAAAKVFFEEVPAGARNRQPSPSRVRCDTQPAGASHHTHTPTPRTLYTNAKPPALPRVGDVQ